MYIATGGKKCFPLPQWRHQNALDAKLDFQFRGLILALGQGINNNKIIHLSVQNSGELKNRVGLLIKLAASAPLVSLCSLTQGTGCSFSVNSPRPPSVPFSSFPANSSWNWDWGWWVWNLIWWRQIRLYSSPIRPKALILVTLKSSFPKAKPGIALQAHD